MTIKNFIKITSGLIIFNLMTIIPFANNDTSIYNFSINEKLSGEGEDYIESIKETADGGFIIVGYSNSNKLGATSTYDALICKYNKSNQLEWITFESGSSNEYFFDVVELSNGDFVAVGRTLSPELSNSTNTDGDGIIVKYNNKGEKQWLKCWGGI